LPAIEDYYLTVQATMQAPADAPGDNYSLWVGIR
jgi:hypothetical protein